MKLHYKLITLSVLCALVAPGLAGWSETFGRGTPAGTALAGEAFVFMMFAVASFFAFLFSLGREG